jgi:hypothetical protein
MSSLLLIAEAYNEYHPEGLLPERIMEGVWFWRMRYGEFSVLLTILALHWLVAAENVTYKDDLTSQSLHKLLELQKTLWTFV